MKKAYTMKNRSHLFAAKNWLEGFGQATAAYQPEINIYWSFDADRLSLYLSVTTYRDAHNMFAVIDMEMSRHATH